jgi:Fe-S cluster assembly protein SufD
MKRKIIVSKGEELILPVVWSGKEKEINYDISLSQEGANIKLLMLLLGSGSNAVNIKVNIIHEKPQTKSTVIVKGILKDSSSIDFNGLVKINKGATLANAWLSAHLLILSDKAKGLAVPSLEILENDVKAGHAATVGKLNELEIFYLMSRGLSSTRAKQLIVKGFLNGFLKEFPKNFKYEL